MRGLPATLVLGVAAVVVPIASAVNPLQHDGLGGNCTGRVDVFCTDTYEECSWDECEEVPYRECMVWVFYLDMSFQPDNEYVCADQPYYQP